MTAGRVVEGLDVIEGLFLDLGYDASSDLSAITPLGRARAQLHPNGNDKTKGYWQPTITSSSAYDTITRYAYDRDRRRCCPLLRAFLRYDVYWGMRATIFIATLASLLPFTSACVGRALERPADAPPIDLGAAADLASAALTDTAIVNVVPLALELVAGRLGGPGNVNATGAQARFGALGRPMLVDTGLYVADNWDGKVQIRHIALPSGDVSLAAGDVGEHESGNPDGTWPFGIGSDGGLWLFDYYLNRIRRYDLGTGTSVVLPLSRDIGNFMVAAMDKQDRAFAVRGSNPGCVIYQIDLATGMTSLLAGSEDSCGEVDGAGSAARFTDRPQLALAGPDELWAMESAPGSIRHIRISTGEVTTLAPTPDRVWSPTVVGSSLIVSSASGTDISRYLSRIDLSTGVMTAIAGGAKIVDRYAELDGVGADAGVWPAGLVYDGKSTVYFSDEKNTIRALDVASARVTTIAGAPPALASEDGVGAAAALVVSDGLAILGQTAYVVDREVKTIRTVDLSSRTMTTFAGSIDRRGLADGVAGDASMSTPRGITAIGSGLVFLDESYSDRAPTSIRSLDPLTGAVVTLATTQTFRDLAVDPSGTWYVTTPHETVARYTPGTNVFKLFAGGDRQGYEDGSATAARFYEPYGVVIEGGLLYVGDTFGLRAIDLGTGAVTTLADHGPALDPCNPNEVPPYEHPWTVCGPTWLASDGAGGIVYTAGSTIGRYDIATGNTATLLGIANQTGVLLGAPPASLSNPTHLRITAEGDLYFTDEHALLAVRGMFAR